MTPTAARIRVPATTANLGAGFDVFGAAVSLHLEARAMSRGGTGARVVSEGEGAAELPDGDENLLWRSFVALCTHAGVAVPDLRVQVTNRIPLERGLGSSSAAIVAGLGLARAACGLQVGDLELVQLAAEIEGHPDNVAPAILGGLVCATGASGGGLVVRRAQPHARLRPVLFVPPTRQATAAARAVLPDVLDRQRVADQAGRASHVLAALLGAWPAEPALAGDLLHEPPRLKAMSATAAVLRALRDAGIHAWLSGAGPAACAAVAADPAVLHVCARVAEETGFALRPLRWDLAGLIARPL